MVAFQVVGNDCAVMMAVQAGQVELNVMAPLMTHNILESLSLRNNFLPVFTVRCIDGITANEDRLRVECRDKSGPCHPAQPEDWVPEGSRGCP